MSTASLDQLLAALSEAQETRSKPVERLKAELDFAIRLARSRPEQQQEWEALIEQAIRLVLEGLEGRPSDTEGLVSEAEEVLAPLGAAAREYAVYCCGHAHIDMNWMWSWPETVAVCHDTFSTMDALMDEFPGFHFSQSQASVYLAMQEHAPELLERIRQRVAEGRWEVTASQWVEGDKNMASGEILCRHLLYTRRWFEENLGLSYDRVKIDWEPDSFGHCWTLPGILQRGGVRRYYHHRSSGPRLQSMSSGETSQLFWWEGKDGSRILAFDDSPNGYNNEIAPRMTHLLFDLERHTGLKMMLWVYGVGDHGGGPTRRHLRAAQEMAQWPIWAEVKLTTTEEFFSEAERRIEQQGLELPVHRGELNFVFEGCYTSQSRIKFANRRGESALVDTEAIAVLASRVAGLDYPRDELVACWRRAMFLQFHDILPGSGVKETVEHAMGQFQETLATTGMIQARGLRAIAERIDTSSLQPAERPGATDLGLGAGAGDGAWWGGVSTRGAGERGGEPFVIFNPAPFERDALAQVKVWDRDLQPGRVRVRDAEGTLMSGQIIETGNYWGHSFAVVAFPAPQLPPLGYRAYAVEPEACADWEPGVSVQEAGRPIYRLGYVRAQTPSPVVVTNEHLELIISPEAGGITSVLDRATGTELVPEGAVLGALDREQEAPHAMTAWQLGPITDRVQPLAGCTLDIVHEGPHLAAITLSARHNDSEYALTISLAAGSRQIDFALDVNWLERGDPQTGVPVLRATFPLAIQQGRANFEIPCGSIEREADGEEAPALTWADLTGLSTTAEGITVGATLANDSKYGHQLSDDAMRLTLLRSSYDPDPLPELGRHEVRYALRPHVGPFDAGDAIRTGYALNHPCVPVATTAHEGELPAEAGAIEMLTPNVMLSGLKLAEDSGALIMRLYGFEGADTEARIRLSHRLAHAGAPAVETDLLEQPLEESTARMEGDVLTMMVPAWGITTVRIGA
ncbi:MAG: glycoside hydrolase family 38 C-terminal domain-containing protein [Armatimonadota bacterium]|nr:glycoside hydrolase family 38 C-terminal domain-containing protein [Armatimonadota bacterium]